MGSGLLCWGWRMQQAAGWKQCQDRWLDRRGVLLPSGEKESTRVALCPQNHEFSQLGGVCLVGGEGSKGHSRQGGGDTPGAKGGGERGKLEKKHNRTARNLPSR